MEHSTHSVQIDAHARTTAFSQFGSQRDEQLLNIHPFDIRAEWILEYCPKCFQVLAAQTHSITIWHHVSRGKC